MGVTIQDANFCAVKGRITQGAGCAHMISHATCLLSQREVLDLIDAQAQDRKCAPKCGLPVCADDQTTGTPVLIPKRGASIIMPAADWGRKKEEVDELCRLAGNDCQLNLTK